MGAAVEFRQVSKRYGPAGSPTVVEDLSLSVPPGEICVLVGPSGCGKTTTLKMVNRLVEPTGGEVLIDGSDVSEMEPTALRLRVGYVIQQVGLFPHRTIADNVATVPRLLGWPEPRVQSRADDLLELVGLDPKRYRGRYPSQLSGGERQRVGVARALAVEPPVMLMDEPFGAVDPIVREHLQDEFLRIHRHLGTTVLFVTHDIDEAVKMGDHVAVMQQGGRLAQYAPPAELLMRPANEFVARFVGEDRALKRLSLMAVGDLALEAGGGRRDLERCPVLSPDASVRDALSLLLAAGQQVGAVVDEQGRLRGLVTVEGIAAALSSPHPFDSAHPVHSAHPFDSAQDRPEPVEGERAHGSTGSP